MEESTDLNNTLAQSTKSVNFEDSAGSTSLEGTPRPGMNRKTSTTNTSRRSASFKKIDKEKENSRGNLIQTMRAIRGLKANVTVRKFSVGGMRFASEKRQIAGLLVIFGMSCIFQPLFTVCSLIGSDGTTYTEGTAFALLIGGFCILLLGIMAVGVGFTEFILEIENEQYTTGLLLWSQTGFISMISAMTALGRQTASTAGFIPEAYDPSKFLNRFLGSMGIIATAAYYFSLFGSITFLGFSLYAFQVKKPHDRDRGYYVSRAVLYSGVLFTAGVSQLVMGVFVIIVYGMKLDYGPIQVGIFLINIPPLTAVVGLLQTVLGLWGIVRPFGILMNGRSDNRFQKAIGLGWVTTLVLQGVVQSAYPPEDMSAGLASTVASLCFNLHFMPFYLDYKTRMTLKRLRPGYFGIVDDEEMPTVDEEDNHSRSNPAGTSAEASVNGSSQVIVVEGQETA